MKKVILTIVISCVLIVALLLAFAKFIVNAPQTSNPSTFGSSQATGTISIPSTTVPNVSTAPPDTSAPQNPQIPETQPPVVPETSPKETESTPPSGVPQTSAPAQNNSDSTEQEESPTWKKMYRNCVTVIPNYHNYDHFALVYLDSDEIPELYMYGDGKAKLCTVDGNYMYGIDLNGYGGGNYHEKSGHFMNVYQDGQYLVMRIYHLTNAFYEVFCGMEDKTTDPPTYYIGDPEKHVAVSEATMKATVAQYMDTSNVKFLHENALTYDEFMALMKN